MGFEAATVGEERIRSLPESEWLARSAEHERVVGPMIDAYRDRRARGSTHPVHDFLFAYYQTNRQVLRRWRPSIDMALQGRRADAFLGEDKYRKSEYGICLDASLLDGNERERLKWICQLLRAAMSRPPRFNCFGLHEWAMVYKAKEIRHETTPLRLSPEEIEKVVESSVIRCSHFDAFRFFTPQAIHLNELQPGRGERLENEQFGCVHFNMDLYRWSYKASPWVGSELIRDCFLLALEARELDMRASPYDLAEYGYDPILIETAEGREAYRAEQQRLFEVGQPLAKRLLRECELVLERADCAGCGR